MALVSFKSVLNKLYAGLRNQKARIKRALGVLTLLFFSFIILDIAFPVPIEDDYSHLILDSKGRVLHGFLNNDEKWRMFIQLDEINPDIEKAFIYKEDRWFYWHPGVNPFALARALWNNVTTGRRTSGASTISMQLARLIEPKERTLKNKFIEMLRAFQLEWHFSKKEILQLYLNRVPYGGNIEGLKAASILYYGRLPHQLSLSQIVALSVIPNKPNVLRIGRYNDAVRKERDRWLDYFESKRVFSEERIQMAKKEGFDYKRGPMPRNAPHLALRLRNTYPGTPSITSTIDSETQQKTENLVYAAHRRLRLRNIRQLAAIVIDNRTMEVIAYVGSPDFFDVQEGAQIDGIRAVRSPGSTLKPLIYAISTDLGFTSPKTIIADVPVHLDGYSPENYDSKYNGPVSTEDALAYSLNIPAVKTLQQIGVQTLVDKLIQANFEQVLRDRNKLGLSLALGGCGVTLEEIAHLYSSFANQGTMKPLKFTSTFSDTSSKKLISPEASYLITQSLTRITRPDLPNSSSSSLRIPKVAWKTGTSYGRRDAWSIGYNKNFTIAVWAGNANNEGAADISGAEIATPILFDLFNTIDYNSPNNWYGIPEKLSYRFVCPITGKPSSDQCEQSVVDWYIPGVSHNQKCNHLVEVSVSPDESISYCTSCRPGVGYKRKSYTDYPPDLLAWMQRSGIQYDRIPSHNPYCTRVLKQSPPRIVSPLAEQEYILDATDAPQIRLSAETSADVNQLYWYVNDRFVGSSERGKDLFVSIEPGVAKISCTDDRGRNTDIRIKVQLF